LKISAKNGCFIVSSGKNKFDPPKKILEKSPSGRPLEKFLPTPMTASSPFQVQWQLHVCSNCKHIARQPCPYTKCIRINAQVASTRRRFISVFPGSLETRPVHLTLWSWTIGGNPTSPLRQKSLSRLGYKDTREIIGCVY